jgi:VWFA-related protein
MKNSHRIACLYVAAVGLTFAHAGRAQQNPATPQQGTAVRTTSEEVLLDVVVRDKKGHPVNNLKPDDFQVFDNGEQKKIVAFRLVQGGEAVIEGGARTQLDPLRQIRLVTMIFQCGSNDARRLAHDAAMGLVKGELGQNVYMAVMTIDRKLEVIQSFTNDPALLRKAIDRANRSENTDFSADTAMVQKQLEQMVGPNTNGAQSIEGQIRDQSTTTAAAQERAPDAAGMANMMMAQMVLQMLVSEQSNAAKDAGRVNIYALLDVVKEQYRLPGRKAILYFREGGFVIPQGMEEPFKSVISIANRSNVSFYAVDARGLTTGSANSGAMNALNRAARSSQDQMGDTGGQAVRPDEAKLFDTGIESTRANTQNTLANLAESTGGMLIANTNDLGTPLHKLAEDIQTYYEIGYAPEIKSYDGSFRKIAIKMSSSDLRVQSRSGYIALPPALAGQGSVLRAYEVPLLTALSSAELPKTFVYQSMPMHFRGAQNQSVCDLVLDVPLANLTFQKRGADQTEGRLSYVALVKSVSGEVIKKFGNDIPMHVPNAERDALASGHFIYTEHFDLPPGRYTLETAVLDGEGNRISARKNSLIMPAPSSALSISSVSVVRNMKDKDASTDQADPLLIGGRLVSPTLNPTISKSSNSNISFYLVIYPNKSASQPPHLSMEFSRNGQVLGSGSPELGQPDKDGRIQYVATVPLSSLESGEYAIRFNATQGAETAEELTTFILQ